MPASSACSSYATRSKIASISPAASTKFPSSWEFVNQTEDTHPMHIHLVRFQILDRPTFDPFEYMAPKNLRFTAPAEPSNPQRTRLEGHRPVPRRYDPAQPPS